jgi:hypothetical protein
MLEPVSTPDPSPDAFDPLLRAVLDGDEGGALEALAVHRARPGRAVDAVLRGWLQARGRGGTIGAQALLAGVAAREVARGLPPALASAGGASAFAAAPSSPAEDPLGTEAPLAAAVAALGFLSFAASRPAGGTALPGPEALARWTGWGEDALLRAALDRWMGAPEPPPERRLAEAACRALIARPDLRSVRALLLATHVAGASSEAATAVEAFLFAPRPGPSRPPAPSPPPTSGPAAVRAAFARACRLDPRPTLGHALLLAAAWRTLRASPGLDPALPDAALLASAATWPRLERLWRGFLRTSHR